MEKQDMRKNSDKKETITKVAVGVGIGLVAAGLAGIYYCAGYKRGVVVGGAAAFGWTIDWLEEKFPEKGVKAAVEAWKEAHPEQWVTVK